MTNILKNSGLPRFRRNPVGSGRLDTFKSTANQIVAGSFFCYSKRVWQAQVVMSCNGTVYVQAERYNWPGYRNIIALESDDVIRMYLP